MSLSLTLSVESSPSCGRALQGLSRSPFMVVTAWTCSRLRVGSISMEICASGAIWLSELCVSEVALEHCELPLLCAAVAASQQLVEWRTEIEFFGAHPASALGFSANTNAARVLTRSAAHNELRFQERLAAHTLVLPSCSLFAAAKAIRAAAR